MSDQFFVERHGKRFGPYSAAQLKTLADSGRLQSKDTIWREGMAHPVEAGKVKKLFPGAQPKTAVLMAPPQELPVAAPPVPLPIPQAPPAKLLETVRKRRAVALRGAIIMSQDGEYVHYRKKCVDCGHEDSSKCSMRIGQGVTRASFFCTKCRKLRTVEINGQMQ